MCKGVSQRCCLILHFPSCDEGPKKAKLRVIVAGFFVTLELFRHSKTIISLWKT